MAGAKKPKPKPKPKSKSKPKPKPKPKKKPGTRKPYDPREERAALATLETRMTSTTEPDGFSAVAREAASLGNDLAMTIYRVVMKPGPDSEVHALIELMNRATALSVAASQQCAHRHVERGNPNRAARTLFDSFRAAGAGELPAAVEQLATLLDGHAPAQAGELRVALRTFEEEWSSDKRRDNAKLRFLTASEAVSRALDWSRLPDAS